MNTPSSTINLIELSPEVRATCGAGPAFFDTPWRNYRREFQLGEQHIPELLEILRSEAEGVEIGAWVGLHARRALGELHAVESLEILLRQARDDDGVVLDLPVIAGLIGAEAMPRLAAQLRRRPDDDDTLVMVAITGLLVLGSWHQCLKGTVVGILCEQLQAYPSQSRKTNGALLAALKVLADGDCSETIDQVSSRPLYYAAVNLGEFPSTPNEAVASD